MVRLNPLILENGTIEQGIESSYVKKMGLLFHLPTQEIRLEAILYALSDPRRAIVVAKIDSAGKSQTCLAFACMGDRVIPKNLSVPAFKNSSRSGVDPFRTSRCRDA